MLIWTLIKIAVKSLTANLLRNLLAMLGIIIGVGAVISMLALGAGTQAQVLSRVNALGTNLLVVRPGGDYWAGARAADTTRTLKLADADAILQDISRVEAVAPLVMGRAQVRFFRQNLNATIVGASQTGLALRGFEVDRGVGFSVLEDEHVARVALLGANAARRLFGGQNPLGETIRIKDVNFQVIGVLKPKPDQGWFDPNDMVLIPLLTAMKQVLGQDYLTELDVKLVPDTDPSWAEGRISAILRANHHLLPQTEDDFHLRNQAELGKMAASLTRAFSLLLGGIASVSLLVGGIGIMHIMLLTVTERASEIGVRKAIGARHLDILVQFLLESMLISSLGGLCGIGLGLTVAWGVSRFTDFTMLVEGRGVMLALMVSALVGIVFGFYPALRAAKLNPNQALGYR
ncbi:MAG: ABC transporter permease [Desulfobacteraceae bacterium]|nr:ABC transporter permease [Desulfobacteraceae bacterium]